jgi:two-component system, NarL family, sensor histidine kinase BarA
MPRIGLSNISLAAKCRLLFGSAVVLIVAAALFVPWYQTESLWDELNVRTAKQMALTVQTRSDLQNEAWSLVSRRIEETWPDMARELNLPSAVPKLVPAPIDHAGEQKLMDEFVRKSFQQIQGVRPAAPVSGTDPHVDVAASEAPGDAKGSVPSGSSDADRSPSAGKQHSEPEDETHRIDVGPNGQRIYRYALAVRRKIATEAGPKGSVIGIVYVALPEPERELETRVWFRLVIAGAGLIAMVLAILVFYLITQRLILSPVRRLRRVAEQVSGGDITVRSKITTGDEFEQLSDAFNNMLGRLRDSYEELRKINRSLDTRLGELAETNVALFESNRLKSEFLANVSHELRTPLASIIGFAELLQETPGQDERVMRFASHIHTSGRMLLNIINDLLDLAKIEAGKMELQRTRFSLIEVCETLIEFTRPLIDKKKLNVELAAEPDLPTMYSDAGKIQQVLYNLMSNAIKFTPEGGAVRILVDRQDEEMIRIGVMDTGPGISPDQQQHIFEKFRQLDSSATREHSGTGLGLAISRELVQILGGTISVESEPGRGAHFIVVLPIESPEQAQRPLVALA